MKLIFELGHPGRGTDYLGACDVPVVGIEGAKREKPLRLPEVSEVELDRHYSRLARLAHGVNDGFYPLGSCTMKYNPAVNEYAASLPGFTQIHPLQEADTAEGCREVCRRLEEMLCEITGMDAMTLQPAAGAHGEFTGLLLIKAYHKAMGDEKRTKILVPDSAHGTNPASASMAGFEVVSIASDANGFVDLEALKAAVGEDTAGLMLTNPNTVGLFDPQILEITRIVHEAGGLNYYDGANLNAVMGVARPGDMGFDVVHLNLHKTFSTPHGGGGPGSGPGGCKKFLEPFLPGRDTPESIGNVRSFGGNFLVVVLFPMAYDRICMHEFVMTLEKLKEETGVSALDVAKAMLDHGIHPPTMYFPLIVHEALMVEPTETETRETLDEAVAVLREIWGLAHTDPQAVHSLPKTTAVRRPDEVGAARNPRIRYDFEAVCR